jgi:hypothetical protein
MGAESHLNQSIQKDHGHSAQTPEQTVARDGIKRARSWLKSMVIEERCTKKRCKVTAGQAWDEIS